MKIRCIIIEDEPLAYELLASYIKKVPSLELIKYYKNAIEAFAEIQNIEVDIIFLDIQMPGMSGIELLHCIPSLSNIILVSAHKEHALDSFNFNVIDYLLKPASFERFMKSIGKAAKNINNHKHASLLNETSKPSAYVYLRVNKENIKVMVDDIFWIESKKDYIKIVTKERSYTVYQRISVIEQRLPENSFLRVHRSFIVALDKIEASTLNHVRIQDVLIPIGKVFKQEVLKRLKA